MNKTIILCVDDEKIVLNSLKAQLKKHFGNEYSIETSDNGDDAFEFVLENMVQGNEIPVVISDHIMPGMKGDELLINVYRQLPRTLSVMLTGQADAEAVGNTLNHANLYRYISKPWDETDLKMTISEALRRYYHEKQIEAQNKELEKLVRQLMQNNETLERKVLERTALIQEQKEEITTQLELLAAQNRKITDSLEYASLIQSALLPDLHSLKQLFPYHFLLFKPRDIVSGDFYWYKQMGNSIYLAVADCTGHGVPGAFMGTLGISLLNEILNTSEKKSPDRVLCELREKIKISLRQAYTQDGMDIALCLLCLDSLELSFSGANSAIYLLREGHIEEYKGDKMPIGIYPKDDQDFTCQQIQLKSNDVFYLFSDGYFSQFGGEKSFKFSAKRFREILLSFQHKGMADQKLLLEQNLRDWQGNSEQVDDITVIGIKIGTGS
jgi:phosphoserine phosphatase RsbU/P